MCPTNLSRIYVNETAGHVILILVLYRYLMSYENLMSSHDMTCNSYPQIWNMINELHLLHSFSNHNFSTKGIV